MNVLHRTLALIIDRGYIKQAEGRRFTLAVVQDPDRENYGNWAIICNVTGGAIFLMNWDTVYWSQGNIVTTTIPDEPGRWRRKDSHFEKSMNHPGFQEGWIDEMGHGFCIGDPNTALYYPYAPGKEPSQEQRELAYRWYGVEVL